MKCFFFIFLFLLTNLNSLLSQDSHYWYRQYGTQGELLGGTVIGGITDLSATFYNPGAIALTTDTSLIEGASVLEFVWINAKDAAGKGRDLNSTFISGSPGIFALRLPIKGLGSNQLAVSYIIKSDLDYQSEADRHDLYETSNPDGPYISGNIYNKIRVSEIWPGITWSNTLSKIVGIGATLYLPIRSQRSRIQGIASEIDKNGNYQGSVIYDQYSYYNVRMLAKIGVAINLFPFTIGFSLTTPSFNLFGNGEVKQSIGATVTIPEQEIIGVPYLSANLQKDLPTYWNTPLSIGAGVVRYFKNTTIYFSLEWFNKVNSFNVMKPASYRNQSSGKLKSYDISHEFKSVFNWGFGVQQKFSDYFTLYGGITTDKTADDPSTLSRFNISSWDIIHITLGGGFKLSKMNITLGAGYASSSDDFLRFFKLSDDVQDVGKIKFQRLKLIFGLRYTL